MDRDNSYKDLMNHAIFRLFSKAARLVRRKPSLGWFALRTLFRQKKAARVRKEWEGKGIHVPAFMIVSVTGHCNLHCKGCYARAQHRQAENEMSIERLTEVVREAGKLGISILLLAGGEPLMKAGLLDLTAQFPELIFPIFTNGLMIDQNVISSLKKQPHVIPVISLEGKEQQTDQRRGKGVFACLEPVLKEMKKEGVFYGTSLTVTSWNFHEVTDDRFIDGLMELGCRLFFFVEYVPVSEGTEDLVLAKEQRARLRQFSQAAGNQHDALFIAFPGDEEKYGGCLAAGRGFIHVNAQGGVEPCPFAPYSDVSLQQYSLTEALQSNFLDSIRQNHSKLSETGSGCALWENRQWLQSLLDTNEMKDGEKARV